MYNKRKSIDIGTYGNGVAGACAAITVKRHAREISSRIIAHRAQTKENGKCICSCGSYCGW